MQETGSGSQMVSSLTGIQTEWYHMQENGSASETEE